MPVWEFEIIQAGKERVQGAGLRPFIVSLMLEGGFERGNVVNSADGRGVYVFVECESRQAASSFKSLLARETRQEAKSGYSTLPAKFKLSAVKKQNFHIRLPLPLLGNKAPAMALSQTSKGVGVMVAMHRDLRSEIRKGFGTDMRRGFGGLRTDMHKEFGSLRSELRKGFGVDMQRGFSGVRQELGSLRSEMRKGFDRLPDRMAKALAKALQQANKTSQNS